MSKDAIIEVQRTCSVCGGNGFVGSGRAYACRLGKRVDKESCLLCKGKCTVTELIQGQFIGFAEDKS